MTIRGGVRRANYARKKKIYAQIGENVLIQPRVVPIYSELIKVAKNVDFCTHDFIHGVLNRMSDDLRRE